jgi:hypothetical protein
LGDVIERLLGKEAFRCRICRKRFFAPQSHAAGFKEAFLLMHNQRSNSRLSARTRRHLMRKLVIITIFAIAFVLFWVFLRYIIAEANPAQSTGGFGIFFSGLS